MEGQKATIDTQKTQLSKKEEELETAKRQLQQALEKIEQLKTGKMLEKQ